MSTSQEDAFLEKVKLAPRRVNNASEPRRWRSFVAKGFGYFFAVLAVGVTFSFLGVMETTYEQLGGSQGSGILDTITSQESLSKVVDLAGLSWIPAFLKIYDIRWLIALGVFAFFGILATTGFVLGRHRDKK